MTTPQPRRADDGSIVLGWLTRLAALISLFGLLAFDGIALVKSNFSAADHASTAASAAADTYKQSKDAQQAYNAAVATLTDPTETIDPASFIVTPTDGHIELKVTQEATTLWLHRIGPLKKYVTVTASGEGNPPS